MALTFPVVQVMETVSRSLAAFPEINYIWLPGGDGQNLIRNYAQPA